MQFILQVYLILTFEGVNASDIEFLGLKSDTKAMLHNEVDKVNDSVAGENFYNFKDYVYNW